ncbi:restriction endonuclease [Vibrio lentus]|uniref:restriction endonuclease n=1 Tax=Vibrio lentus TaxID=136468 RepID=UPI00178CA6CB|nr:restriction endonuclease [Vibrio lentus]MDN3631239.1 restriction endonuclease [Vibrio lentus]MDN3632753.1 restriction endonuclease [Vibrio lentus]
MSLFEDKFSKQNILAQLDKDIASGEGFWTRFNQHDFDISKTKEGDDFKSIVLVHINSAILEYWLIENNYVEPLLRKQRQLTYVDEYGDKNTDDFDKEIDKFVKKRRYSIEDYVYQSAPNYYKELAKSFDGEIYLFTDDLSDLLLGMSSAVFSVLWDAAETSSDTDNYQEDNDDITPYEYEKLISQRLTELGWDSYATSGSGDQGADVLAEKYGVSMVVQCKMYSKPVGNKAVQEVSSARDYYEKDLALVVTNNDFTKSARQLADSQQVYLLHDSQIEEFDSLLFAEEQ